MSQTAMPFAGEKPAAKRRKPKSLRLDPAVLEQRILETLGEKWTRTQALAQAVAECDDYATLALAQWPAFERKLLRVLDQLADSDRVEKGSYGSAYGSAEWRQPDLDELARRRAKERDEERRRQSKKGLTARLRHLGYRVGGDHWQSVSLDVDDLASIIEQLPRARENEQWQCVLCSAWFRLHEGGFDDHPLDDDVPEFICCECQEEEP